MINFEKYGIFSVTPTPNERQLAHYRMGKKAFFHFGVNTFTDVEWGNGEESEKSFAPTELNIDQWISSIKDAGFSLAIITAKHHDGFCLWPSKFTEHSIKNSPYKDRKGDIIREFTDSCRKYGIKAGVYISPWDRNAPTWGKEEYSFYYADQLRELLTEYGELHEVWWDGAGSTETVYHWDLWAKIVRECQPKACIFGSMGATPFVDLRWVGNEKGYAGEKHYATIHADALGVEARTELNEGDISGDRYIPSETDVSIRPGWFYHSDQDDQVKTPAHISKIWFESIGRNSMMLLNFPPDRRGLLPETDVKNALLSHQAITKMLSKDYMEGACLSADQTLHADLCVKNLALTDEDSVWAATEKEAYIDIFLDGTKKINVFCVSEAIEVGERIKGYRLESIENGKTKILYEGSSVGFYRAIPISEDKYTHLCFTITDAVAPAVLRKIGLHFFEDDAESEKLNSVQTKVPIVAVTYEDGGNTAIISFGGIYPFRLVSFHPSSKTPYRISVFNGQSYDVVANGIADPVYDRIRLNNVQDGAYQIKIETECGFADEEEFGIFLK